MDGRWALAFTVSALLALVGAASVRRAARRPGAASRVIRRSGGIVLIAALAGWLFAPSLPRAMVGAALGTIAATTIGLLADRQRLTGRGVPVAIVAVSVVPVVAGVRAEITGVPGTDVVLTVLGIACVTAAVAGLGNTDGLLGGVVGLAAIGVFALAAFGDQDVVATTALALTGACVGFLSYNLRPASVFVGQAGGLPAGLLLAVFAIEVRPAIATPESFAVPLVLLALPIMDGVVVAAARLRHRRRLTARRPDHIPHRLAALGWSPGAVVSSLITLQLVLTGVALFVGRGVLSLPLGAGIAMVPVVVLTFFAAHGRVYPERAQGPSAAVVLVGLGVGLLAVVAAVPAVAGGVAAREHLDDGKVLARSGVAAARRGEPDVAALRFQAAAEAFDRARSELGGPLVAAGLAVPVLGSNLYAAQELSDAGFDLARAGEQLTGPVDPEALRVRNGTVALDEVRRITPSLEEAAALLSQTEERVADLDMAFLVEPVRDAIDEVQEELEDAQRDAVRGAAAARIAPAILGGDGPRRYFLAVQNPAELRGAGGFIGNWGIVTVDNGTIDLEFIERVRVLNEGGDGSRTIDGPAEYLRRYGRFEPANSWQNVNMAPDFPVVGEVIAGLYPQSGGEPVDGVIGVDPLGLAALLELTGPVTVPDWPEPVTADNVVDVTLRDAYESFARTPDRADFLGDVARQAVDVATEGDLGRPAKIGEVLGRASRQGHLSLYFTRPEEQRVAELLNASGSVPRTEGDSLLLVTQNAGANKIDYYLRRQLGYSVVIDPDPSGESARVHGTLSVQLENTAPDAGLPQSVIGPSEGLEDRFVAGQNRSYLSAYTPLELTEVTHDGGPVTLEPERELGRNVFSTFVDVFARSSTSFALGLDGQVGLSADRWYTLELVRQPFLAPDTVLVDIAVAPGWRIAETAGVRTDGEGNARGVVELSETTTIGVRLEPTGGRNLWDRLHHGP